MKKVIFIFLIIVIQFFFISNSETKRIKKNSHFQIMLKMQLEKINNYWYFNNKKFKYKIKLKNSNTWRNAYFNKYNGFIYYSKSYKTSEISDKSLLCRVTGELFFGKIPSYCKKWFYFLPRNHFKAHNVLENSYRVKDLRFSRYNIKVLSFIDKIIWQGGLDQWKSYNYEEKNPEYDGKENNYFFIKKTINLKNIFISLQNKTQNILYKSISKKQKIRVIKKSNKQPILKFNIKNFQNIYTFIKHKKIKFYLVYTFNKVNKTKVLLNFSKNNSNFYWKINRENWKEKNKSLYFYIYAEYREINKQNIIPFKYNRLYFFTNQNWTVYQYDFQKKAQKIKIKFINKEIKEYKNIIQKKNQNTFSYFFFNQKEVKVILWKNKYSEYIYVNNKLLKYFKTKIIITLKPNLNNIIKVVNIYNNFLLYNVYFHKSKLKLLLFNNKEEKTTKKYFRIINKKNELIEFIKYEKLKFSFRPNLKYKHYNWVINKIIVTYKAKKEKKKYIKLNTFFIEKKGFYKIFLYLYNGLKIYLHFYINDFMWSPNYSKSDLKLIKFFKIKKKIEEQNNNFTIISIFKEKEKFYLNKVNSFFKNLKKIKKIIISKFKYLIENEKEVLQTKFKNYNLKTFKNKQKYFRVDDLIYKEKEIFIKHFRKVCSQKYNTFLKENIKKHNLEEWENKILLKTKKEKPKTFSQFKRYTKNYNYIFFLKNEKKKIISLNKFIKVLKLFGISTISFIILSIVAHKLYKKYIFKKNKNKEIWKF